MLFSLALLVTFLFRSFFANGGRIFDVSGAYFLSLGGLFWRSIGSNIFRVRGKGHWRVSGGWRVMDSASSSLFMSFRIRSMCLLC